MWVIWLPYGFRGKVMDNLGFVKLLYISSKAREGISEVS